ncbi:MAG: histidine kinase [Nocardioides sp.]
MTSSVTAPWVAAPVSTLAGRVYLWIGIVLAVIGVAQLLAERPDSVSWLALVGALVAGGAVVLLPRLTIPALLGLSAAIVTMVAAVEVPVFASFVAVMIAAFTLARYSALRAALLGYSVLVGTVAVVAAPELENSSEGVFGLVYPIFYFGGAGLLGWLTRKRAEHVRSLVAYAEVLEREQNQRVELAAAAERERLARDMHDVVSHGVSLMVLQAEAAREVLHRQPDDAAVALDAIADAGRSAMSDLHRMLRVLRGPGFDLDALVSSVRATGLAVDLRVQGDWALVEDETRAALFRVAQESLTNTLRHAAGVELAVIDVVCGPDVVVIEIVDDGRGDAGFRGGAGCGLRGLSERLTALGGTFEVGQRADGPGFRVSASAPRKAA